MATTTATATRTAKKAICLDKQNDNLHVHHAFFVHFSAVVARPQRETASFHVLSRTGTKDNNFLFLFLNFDAVLRIQLQKDLPTFDELNEME